MVFYYNLKSKEILFDLTQKNFQGFIMKLFVLLIVFISSLFSQNIPTKKLAYVVSDINIRLN